MTKQKLNLSTEINASKEKIWKVLLEDETYRQWTTPFSEGSYAEGNWEEGSKMLFLGPTGEGMVSRIILHKPNEIISIEHYGMLKNNIEDLESDEVKKWAGAVETYRLEPNRTGNTLFIEMDVTDEYADWMKTAWQKALEKVKELAEK